ncbi:MAG: DUF305 domain-containing protein [Gemmatimonadetes bacterium]|nr:DUF305 domain-containing protein [Gemmatimonadota bacterium]
MSALSFGSMYVLMYAMVNTLANVYLNVNQFYRAGLMAAPMALIELALMRSMYRDRWINLVVIAASVAGLTLFWVLIREQVAVSDRQFLRSMIPHHGGAILMCQEAPIRDPGILGLCERIKASQQSEIDEMKAKLRELER